MEIASQLLLMPCNLCTPSAPTISPESYSNRSASPFWTRDASNDCLTDTAISQTTRVIPDKSFSKCVHLFKLVAIFAKAEIENTILYTRATTWKAILCMQIDQKPIWCHSWDGRNSWSVRCPSKIYVNSKFNWITSRF